MKYLDEYRDPEKAQRLMNAIQPLAQEPRSLMEICGGQTHSIIKNGIDEMLPETITLIHGPGCPVCVTPQSLIDRALEIASRDGVIFCTFGDMLRVPGTHEDLYAIKARGGDVRIVYSPLDALQLAEKNPEKQVVFFGVGFETTAPTTAMAVYQAKLKALENFSILCAHVLVPPAMEAILSSPECRVQGFLAAGHVCAVMGCEPYEPIAKKYQVPIVVTGFEPIDILEGIYLCLKQMHEGRFEVENQYARTVREQGNPAAMNIIQQVYEPSNRDWRGLGNIAQSGYELRDEYKAFDASIRFAPFESDGTQVESGCISGQILQGIKKPHECPEFAKACTPESPLGAPMVSSEGACAAYYRYRRYAIDTEVTV